MTPNNERWTLAGPVRHDRSLAAALARAATREPLDVYDSRTKLALLLVLSIGFVAIGVFAIRHGAPLRGGLATAFFSLTTIAGVWRLIKSSAPTLRFDAEGVTFRRGARPFRLLWSDLRSAHIATIRRTKLVCLVPRDLEATLAAAAPASRALMRTNVKLVGAPYSLPTAVSLGSTDLLRVIHAYAPELTTDP